MDSDEVGALHYAARYNHQAVMQLLVDFNASQLFNLFWTFLFEETWKLRMLIIFSKDLDLYTIRLHRYSLVWLVRIAKKEAEMSRKPTNL